MSLLVILATRGATGEATFAAWAGAIPFLVSVLLLAVSLWIRLQLNESPAFAKMKAEGATSRAPLAEAFGTWKNARRGADRAVRHADGPGRDLLHKPRSMRCFSCNRS